MSMTGLALCTRYAYPPNSLSLCGPAKQTDLKWYATSGQADLGVRDILSQFSTLYPYLSLIAYENGIRDPFSTEVIEAYWLGNQLLSRILPSHFYNHLSDTLDLKRKLEKKYLNRLFSKLLLGALPHHSFHVVNVYKRTGHIDTLQTVQTMDACIINVGKIVKILPQTLIVRTRPLGFSGDQLTFAPPVTRTISTLGDKDHLLATLSIGDYISYHWGNFCQKITRGQVKSVLAYTRLSLVQANAI